MMLSTALDRLAFDIAAAVPLTGGNVSDIMMLRDIHGARQTFARLSAAADSPHAHIFHRLRVDFAATGAFRFVLASNLLEDVGTQSEKETPRRALHWNQLRLRHQLLAKHL